MWQLTQYNNNKKTDTGADFFDCNHSTNMSSTIDNNNKPSYRLSNYQSTSQVQLTITTSQVDNTAINWQTKLLASTRYPVSWRDFVTRYIQLWCFVRLDSTTIYYSAIAVAFGINHLWLVITVLFANFSW